MRKILAAAVIIALAATLARADEAKPKLRIVSLAPNVTEMLFSLGVGDQIVGATDFCNYPAEAKKIPRVGGLGQPNLEKVISIAPDLVVYTDLERKEIPDLFRKSGITVLELKIRNFSELFDAYKKLGKAVDRSEQADKMVQQMQSDLKTLSSRFADVPKEARPKVYIEIWGDPVITAGGKSFIDDLISKAGGVNVAHDLDRDYPTINPEKVVEWDPDIILVCYMIQESNPSRRISSRIGWSGIKAVKNGKIITDISSDYLLRPGPRLVEGAKLLSEKFYPAASRPEEKEKAK